MAVVYVQPPNLAARNLQTHPGCREKKVEPSDDELRQTDSGENSRAIVELIELLDSLAATPEPKRLSISQLPKAGTASRLAEEIAIITDRSESICVAVPVEQWDKLVGALGHIEELIEELEQKDQLLLALRAMVDPRPSITLDNYLRKKGRSRSGC